MSEPNDSISSGFEPDTPTSLFGQRIHTGDSQEDLTFDNDSGQFGVNDRTISNQDEIPLIEPHQSSNPRLEMMFYFSVFNLYVLYGWSRRLPKYLS